jgi:hypothetical protein
MRMNSTRPLKYAEEENFGDDDAEEDLDGFDMKDEEGDEDY